MRASCKSWRGPNRAYTTWSPCMFSKVGGAESHGSHGVVTVVAPMKVSLSRRRLRTNAWHRPLEHSCTSRSPATVAAVLAASPVRRRTVCPDASCKRRCCRRASCVRHQRRRQYQDFSRKPDALSDNYDSYDISVTSHSSPVYRSYIHRESKKQDTQLLAITSITII